jgi:hypothetical protein
LSDIDPKLPRPNPKDDAAFLAMMEVWAKSVHDRYYKGQIIQLDGYTFTNCCFHNCRLVAATGLFVLRSCTLIHCASEFSVGARRTIQLFNYHGASAWPKFNPTVAADGSISID